VADYRFETTWRLPASPTDAWDLLVDAEGWPRWWPSVRRVEQLTPGSPGGVGRRLRYHFRTRLPYTLTFEAELVEMTEPTRLVAVASGELAGTWTCDLAQDGESVVVRHVWAVSTTRRWMNALAPLARPVFSWNHASLMREGGYGFAAHLGTYGEVEGAPVRRRAGYLLAGAAAVVAVGLALVVRAARRRR
jgi:uncharacterized protein YndB with AHSA1/START domain